VSKTTRKSYTPEFKMAVALEATRGEKTLSQVASEHGVSPSLVCEWRDQLERSADNVFGRTQQDCERKRSEEAAQRRYDEALRKIGQPAVERDFLQRFCGCDG
jgi:transposase-like protein